MTTLLKNEEKPTLDFKILFVYLKCKKCYKESEMYKN